METLVYIATSLEGYISRPEGELDWLMDDDFVDEGEDYGFAQLFKSVSCLAIDEQTFETVLHSPEWPFADKRLVVMSQHLEALPEGLPETVELFDGTPAELIKQLKRDGEKRLLLDGGSLIREFTTAALVDRFILTRIPVLIGSGVPLFGALQRDLKLKHIRTQSYPSGLVQSEYIKR